MAKREYMRSCSPVTMRSTRFAANQEWEQTVLPWGLRTETNMLLVHGPARTSSWTTCLPLPSDLCKAARAKELEHFNTKKVWDVRSIDEARRRMGRAPISVR